MAITIPTNDQILARLKGKPAVKAPLVPSLAPPTSMGNGVPSFSALKTNLLKIPGQVGAIADTVRKAVAPTFKEQIGNIEQEKQQNLLPEVATKLATTRDTEQGITRLPQLNKTTSKLELSGPIIGGDIASTERVGINALKATGEDLVAKAKNFIGKTAQEIEAKLGDVIDATPATTKSLAMKLSKATSPEHAASIISDEVKALGPKIADRLATQKEPQLNISEQKPVSAEAPSLKETPQPRLPASEELPRSARLNESLLDDTTQIAKSADTLNLEHLNISDKAKGLIDRELKDLSKVSEKVGTPLTHKELLATAKDSSKILARAVGRDQTAAWDNAMLNLRQKIAANAESGTVTKDFLNDLVVLKTQGTDVARKLNSLAIKADPREMTGKRAILDAVLRVNDNVDEILKASEGVDFNDPKQATEFYRKFISPKTSEWLDLLRYNSMLSSPKTHFINIFSNAVNATVAPTLTKAIRGGFDFLGSAATGRNRKYYAGEAGAYLKGLVSNYKKAVSRFGDVWKGKRDFTNLDYRNVPLATKGAKAVIEKFLNVPTRALEGADQFFMELVQSGERAALEHRQSKGVAVKNIEQKTKDAANYILYRSELKDEKQGHLLNAMDTLTGVVQRLRNDPNPIISYPAKFTFPFIATPTNILKQGIEFSPAGFATIPGAKDKMEQAVKAAIGTGVAIAGGTLIASNRMTWGEPTTQADKNAFRQSGMQPYSIKLGDRWYSYQKLPPFLAFPLSMVAVVNDALQNKKLDDGTADIVLSSVAKYASFFADQSYFKSMGDLWSAINGDEYAISRLIGNYPQQLVPYRALTGWLARLTDPTQRTIASDATFIDRQVQLLMQQYPGLSQMTTPRLGPTGEPVANPEPVLNAFSPIQTQKQSEEQTKDYATATELKSLTKKQTQVSASITSQAQALVEKARGLSKDEGTAFLSEQTKGNTALAAKVKSVIADQNKNLNYTEKLIGQLGVENGQRAQYIVSHVQQLGSKEEKVQYLNNLKAKGLISKNVQAQIKDLLSKP